MAASTIIRLTSAQCKARDAILAQDPVRLRYREQLAALLDQRKGLVASKRCLGQGKWDCQQRAGIARQIMQTQVTIDALRRHLQALDHGHQAHITGRDFDPEDFCPF